VITDATGRAPFTALEIRGPAGTKSLEFSAPGLTAVSSSVTTTGGAPVAIELYAGDQQTEGEALPVPGRPAVRLTDFDGNGSPSAPVIFAVATGGGAVTGAAQTPGPDFDLGQSLPEALEV
jgi:hypothetical protein